MNLSDATRRALNSTLTHINVSAREHVTATKLWTELKSHRSGQRASYHLWAFFDETDLETLADLGAGGDITHAELARLADELLPTTHPTRQWVHEYD